MNYAETINSIVPFSKSIPADLEKGELSKLLTYLVYSFQTLNYFRNSSFPKTMHLVNETEPELIKERKDLFYIQLNSTIKIFLKENGNVNILGSNEQQSGIFKSQYLNILENYGEQIDKL